MSWVYVIRATESDGRTSYVKIGQTRQLDVMERAGWTLVECPPPTEFIHAIQCPYSKSGGCEKILHARFSHKRVRGEWFDLDSSDIEFIKSIRKMEFQSEAHYIREYRRASGTIRALKQRLPDDPSPFVAGDLA